jgi:hypothetical protein
MADARPDGHAAEDSSPCGHLDLILACQLPGWLLTGVLTGAQVHCLHALKLHGKLSGAGEAIADQGGLEAPFNRAT